MPTKTWKRVESRLATIFGAKRRPLSGGNQGEGRDDAIHPRLFIECKHRKKSSLATLYYKTAALAARENKIPVLGIHEAGRHGTLIVIHSSHLLQVLSEVCNLPPKRPRGPRGKPLRTSPPPHED